MPFPVIWGFQSSNHLLIFPVKTNPEFFVLPFKVNPDFFFILFFQFSACKIPYGSDFVLIGYDDGISKCDLSKGHWIPDLHGSLYTNSSCTTIPDSKNCFRHGRSDRDFLNWRWKPDQCNLPRFDPKAFLAFVKGKTLGFVGDSVARNHMESVLCGTKINNFG